MDALKSEFLHLFTEEEENKFQTNKKIVNLNCALVFYRSPS